MFQNSNFIQVAAPEFFLAPQTQNAAEGPVRNVLLQSMLNLFLLCHTLEQRGIVVSTEGFTEWCKQLFPTTSITRGTAIYKVTYHLIVILRVLKVLRSPI